MTLRPRLECLITESGTVKGEYSLKAITAQGPRELRLLLKQAGFRPGDVVTIKLKGDNPSAA